MRATQRWALVLVACVATACATAEDPESAGPAVRADANATDDTGVALADAPAADSTVATDTAPDPTDTTTSDSALAIDTGADETEPMDSGTLDTGTVVMDTAPPPTCSESGKYGGTCKTNLDCASIPGCGYVCCAYDPSGSFSLGCGRVSGGSFCLP
jgi:hypothetical protein